MTVNIDKYREYMFWLPAGKYYISLVSIQRARLSVTIILINPTKAEVAQAMVVRYL